MNITSNRVKSRIYNLSNEKDCFQIIEDKLNDSLNKCCVECGKDFPEYISVNNGIFLCDNCVQNHFNFPDNISTIKRNDLNSLTLNEIQYIYFGGNKNLLLFIHNEFPKLTEYPPNLLYKTEAMNYYRNNLEYLVNGGIKPEKPSKNKSYEIIENIYYNSNTGDIPNNIYINYNNYDKSLQTFDNNCYDYKNRNSNLINNLGYDFCFEPINEINIINSPTNSINSSKYEKKNNSVICYNQNQINNTNQNIKIINRINNQKLFNNKKINKQLTHFNLKNDLSSRYLNSVKKHAKINIYKKPIIIDSKNASIERETSADILNRRINFSQDKKNKFINKNNLGNFFNHNYSISKTSNYTKNISNIEEIPIEIKNYHRKTNLASEENTLFDLNSNDNSSFQKDKNKIIKIPLESKKNENTEVEIEKNLEKKCIVKKLKNIKEKIINIKNSARILESRNLTNLSLPMDSKKVINVLSTENCDNNMKNVKEENKKNIENIKYKEINRVLSTRRKYDKKNKESNDINKNIEIKKEIKQEKNNDSIKKEKDDSNENEMSCAISRMDFSKFLLSEERKNARRKIRLISEPKEKTKDIKKSADFNKDKEKDKKEKQVFSIRRKYKLIKIK